MDELENLRTAADFNYDWEYWISPNAEIMYCSASCNRITGYSSEEFIKTPDLISSLVHTQDIEIYNNHIEYFHDQNKHFEQGQELEFREGVGMGLFLVKEIINQHGGDIWYEAKDNGSDFVFTLPK